MVMLASFMVPDALSNVAGLKPFSMELKQLSYFVAVANSGSFSKAAVRSLGRPTHPRRQIKLLENAS